MNNADEVVENHCKDCCCARAWKALGIAKYTGKSIPEHIVEMREALEFVAEYAEVGEIIDRAKDALSGVLVPSKPKRPVRIRIIPIDKLEDLMKSGPTGFAIISDWLNELAEINEGDKCIGG